MTARGYGANRLEAYRQDLEDRRNGYPERSRARWGYVRPPGGRGRVLWIKAGDSYDSIRLAVDLACAIHDRRRDVRIVTTFEVAFPPALARLRSLARAAMGYGPCDVSSAVDRFLARLDPLAVLVVDSRAGEHLMRALARGERHVVAVHAEYPGAGYFEAGLPRDEAAAERLERHAHCFGSIAEPVDGLSMLVDAHASPSLKVLATAGEERTLWWWQGVSPGSLAGIGRIWQTFAREVAGILILGGVRCEQFEVQWSRGPVVSISSWDRSALPVASVIRIDDPRWEIAVAAAADGVHFSGTERGAVWQCAAMGATMSFGPEMPQALSADLGERSTDEPAEVIARWRSSRSLVKESRSRADRARRRFWLERRRARIVFDELLDRVFAW